MKIGLGVIVGSMLLVIAEGYSAYWNKNFFPSQVLARWGRPGIAFFAHGGMWGDLFLLPGLFAFIITRYGATWSTRQILLMGSVGVTVTTANHLLCIGSPVPDPLGWQGEKWSLPIALHYVYMSIYVAFAGLFYFSPGVSVREAVLVSIVLGLHTAAGTHVFLGLFNRWFDWPWCQDFLGSPVLPWLQAGIWTALIVFAGIAAGWRASLSVAGSGAALLAFLLFLIEISPPATRPYG